MLTSPGQSTNKKSVNLLFCMSGVVNSTPTTDCGQGFKKRQRYMLQRHCVWEYAAEDVVKVCVIYDVDIHSPVLNQEMYIKDHSLGQTHRSQTFKEQEEQYH